MEEDEDKDEDQCGDVYQMTSGLLWWIDPCDKSWPVHEGGWAKSPP